MISNVIGSHRLENPSYVIEVDDDKRRRLAGMWLWLSVIALLCAGIFSVLLVLA